MDQKLIIIRGTACSGKTTIAEKLRDYDKRIVWLSIDKIKPIFSDFKDETLDDVNKTAMVVLQDLLERNFSVVLDGIFKNPEHLYQALQIAEEKNVPVIIYQLNCSLEVLKERDKSRFGGQHALGEELITSLYNTVEENPIEDAIPLDTEKLPVHEILGIINQNFI